MILWLCCAAGCQFELILSDFHSLDLVEVVVVHDLARLLDGLQEPDAINHLHDNCVVPFLVKALVV